MSRRLRTLIGTFVMIAYVFMYAMIAIMLIQSRILEWPHLAQTAAYLILGIIWVVPLLPLLKWMARNNGISTQ